MFTYSPSLIRALGFLLTLFLILMPGLTPISTTSSIASADASTPRSYVEFINGAYFGALHRFPSCLEEQAEYDALTSAASVGALHEEAQRFVSTLFETRSSYDAPDSLLIVNRQNMRHAIPPFVIRSSTRDRMSSSQICTHPFYCASRISMVLIIG